MSAAAGGRALQIPRWPGRWGRRRDRPWGGATWRWSTAGRREGRKGLWGAKLLLLASLPHCAGRGICIWWVESRYPRRPTETEEPWDLWLCSTLAGTPPSSCEALSHHSTSWLSPQSQSYALANNHHSKSTLTYFLFLSIIRFSNDSPYPKDHHSTVSKLRRILQNKWKQRKKSSCCVLILFDKQSDAFSFQSVIFLNQKVHIYC